MNGNAVDHFLDRHVREGRGGRTVAADAHRSLTYAELQSASIRFASALAAAGVGRERRMAMLMLDTIDFLVAFWGALRAGVVPVPVNTMLTPDLIGYILADSRAEVVVVSAPLLDAVAPLLSTLPALRLAVIAAPDGSEPKTSEISFPSFLDGGAPEFETVFAPGDEVAFWLYSSGSTGAPKGARHLHSSLRATADTYGAQVLGIEPDDVMFSAAKLFFAYGFGNAMTFPMSVGASCVLLAGRPAADAVLETMRRFQPTLFGGVPTLYAGLLAHPAIGPGAGSARLRRCISAGEALPAHVGERWRQTVGVEILDGIGSTEMLHIFLSNRSGEVRPGSTGRAVPGYALRIVDGDGRDVPDGQAGELLVRGDSAADGYWNQRAKSRKTFRGEWTHTGDTYVRDADGFHRFQGRADDMLKVGGIWVSPFEVEDALGSHAWVLEAAVVGAEDADGLTKPRAFVVLQPHAEGEAPDAVREALKAHVKARIGPWKYPRWIEIVDALPKTATGKIQRYKLREAGA